MAKKTNHPTTLTTLSTTIILIFFPRIAEKTLSSAEKKHDVDRIVFRSIFCIVHNPPSMCGLNHIPYIPIVMLSLVVICCFFPLYIVDLCFSSHSRNFIYSVPRVQIDLGNLNLN